jgi:hypothetical protein
VKCLLLFLFLGKSAVAATPQSLGELEVSRLLLEPSFFVMEPKTSSFEMTKALIGFSWRNDNRWSAHIALGSTNMIGVPKRFGTTNDEFSLLEGYGQWDSGLGTWRVGMLPIDFGLQGGSNEEFLWFPRGLIYQKGYLGIRDFGLSYLIHEGLYFSHLVVHNGEGGTDRDGRAWFTGKWGVNPRNLEFGVSAQAGQTTPQSTNVSGNTSQDSLFSAAANHRLRLAGLFINNKQEALNYQGEVYLAEVLTDGADTTQFSGWNVDLKYRQNSWLQYLIRYEELRTYPSTGREKYIQALIGFVFGNWNQTSNLFMYFIKNFEEPTAVNNDRFQLSWRWTPRAFDL